MISELDVKDLKRKLDNSEDIILIDCREQGEWDESHIKEAKFMPLSIFKEQASQLTNPDAEIIIQCRSGRRSMQACQYLLGEGFTKLANLTGGILAWQEEGFPVVKD